MGLKQGIKTAKSTLSYLAMDDALFNRMVLASGEIRTLGESAKGSDTTKKNQKKVDQLLVAFNTMKEKGYEVRALENLSQELVKLCTDIIEENIKAKK